MLKHIGSLILGTSLLLGFNACTPKNQAKEPIQNEAGDKFFGATPAMKNSPIQLAKAIHENKFDQKLHLKGEIAKVCQKKGCWMIIRDGSTQARVTFKDYGFFVPKDIGGKEVVLEGILSKKVLSKKDAQHFAKDEGQSQAAIDAITGPVEEFSYVAETVVLPKG